MEDKLKLIKEIILNTAKKYNIEIDKIILFGSRARGDYREDSDWDILIVTKKELRKEIFWKFYKEIVKRLAKIRIYGDIIVLNREYVMSKKEDVGNISYYALSEGRII